jgi:hypothetical protein
MKAYLLAACLTSAAVATLSGCVVARTEGHAVVTDAPADNHVRIVIVPALPTPADKRNAASIEADKHMATLFPQLAARLPVDFKRNGVDADATLLDVDSPVPAPAHVRTLVIRPVEAGVGIRSRAGQSWLDLAVTLNDADRGLLWQGWIRLSSGTAGVSYDASAVDHAAVPLLEQLRDAKMIDISWRRPETP